VCGAIEGDTPADDIWIGPEAFLPKIFRYYGDIGGLFFLRQEVASENRTHAEHIKIVRGQPAAEHLHRIAKPGKHEEKEILRRESIEHRLAIAKMLVARRRYANLLQITRFIAAIKMDHSRWFLKRQTAQEQIVDQTENRGV
jgi:hypothetical protein